MSKGFEIRVVHCSDIHLSEQLIDESTRAPHRYGHDIRAFFALDHYLKHHEWDILVISGDLSRVGDSRSMKLARSWIRGTLQVDDLKLGLGDLLGAEKLVATVPGNHDRFNGSLRQGSIVNYNAEFEPIGTNKTISAHIRGVDVKLHLYDSSADGSFGNGRIERTSMTPKSIGDNEINIAVLHHYILQPPGHPRRKNLEIVNSREAAAYFLSVGFDAILVGHLHHRHIDHLSGRLAASLIPGKYRPRNFFRDLKRMVSLKFEGEGLVIPERKKTQDGKFPSSEDHLRYLYLKNHGIQVRPPGDFKNSLRFHEYLQTLEPDVSLETLLKRLQKKKVLVSMAPSACQAEAKKLGLQRLVFRGDSCAVQEIECIRADFDGLAFVEEEPDEKLRFRHRLSDA